MGGATINSEEFLKFQAEQEQFAVHQIELHMRYPKKDLHSGEIAFNKEKAVLEALQAKLDTIVCEHSNGYIDGIQPMFDSLKA